jgi:hypothetical protein
MQSTSAATAGTGKTHGPPTTLIHAPEPIIHVGGISMYAVNPDCAHSIQQALEEHASVATKDPRCERAMNKALEIQRTHPEPNATPSPAVSE